MLLQRVMHHPNFMQQLFPGIGVDAVAVVFQINHWWQAVGLFRNAVDKILCLHLTITTQPIKMIGADQKALFMRGQPVVLKFTVFKIAAFSGF